MDENVKLNSNDYNKVIMKTKHQLIFRKVPLFFEKMMIETTIEYILIQNIHENSHDNSPINYFTFRQLSLFLSEIPPRLMKSYGTEIKKIIYGNFMKILTVKKITI